MADPIRAALERLTGDIQEARDCIEGWGAYASEYFQQKHDLAGDLAAFDRKIAAARAALAAAPEGEPSDQELYDYWIAADAGMLTWAAQVIGERVNEDAPVAGEVAELVAWIHQQAIHGPDAAEWRRAAELLQQQQAKIESLEQQLETERMRVVACGIIAMSDTPLSAAKNRNCDADYWSASADDIARQIDELMRLRAQQTPVPVSDRLPEPNTKVLAHYFNALGNGRTICAIWVPAKSRSDDADFADDDFTEYDEEDDKYYWPEGWYEAIENWDDLGWVAVNEGEVAYWQPLPKWPALPPAPGGGGGMSWQPIDTAPKDGTEILASDYDAIEIVSWKIYEAGSDWESRWGEVMFPAWWQPLPDHPPFPDEDPQP